MSDQTDTASGHINPLSQRSARLEGRSARPVVRVLTGAILLVAFAAVAVLILAPGEVKRLFTAGIGNLGESEAEAEARRREERARRAEIREARIMSDGIVLDAGGRRRAPPADGQREVHRLGQHAELRYGTATAIAAPDRTVVQARCFGQGSRLRSRPSFPA